MLLAIAGMIPVLGIAANAYNAYLYFEEGDILNGILCTAGAIVGVGGFMSTVGMAAKACTLIQAGQYVKAAGLAYTTAAMAYMTVDNAYQTYNLLVENDFTFTEEVQLSIGNTFLAGIGTVAGFKGFINCMNETAAMIQKAEAACFVAGTQVLTREGFKNIEDIQPGDYVYSTSDETGESDYKEVLEVFVKETEVITHVFYATKDNGGQESEIHEIETTLNHRFWCEGEWKAAGTLKQGDLLTLADGTQVEVTEVTFEDRHETVYNMEVSDYHTYYVGEDGVWVHNRYGRQAGSGRRGRQSTSRYDRKGYQSTGRSNNLFGKDRSTKRTFNLTEWRRSISKQNIRDEMELFLGDDYVRVDAGKWRSLDGTRQFRVKPEDFLGSHGIGQPTVSNTPHVHFEFLALRSNGNGFDVIKNIHVPLIN